MQNGMEYRLECGMECGMEWNADWNTEWNVEWNAVYRYKYTDKALPLRNSYKIKDVKQEECVQKVMLHGTIFIDNF